MKIVGKDTSKYEEMEDITVLMNFISQTFRDDVKRSGKSYSSEDEKMHLSTNMWNLSVWSDLAKRTFCALMDDGIDSTGAERMLLKLILDFDGGFVQICNNEEKNHKREKLATTDTADKVDQNKKHKVRHEHEEPNTTGDTNTTDNNNVQKKKLKEIHELTLLPVLDSKWVQHTLSRDENDTKAAESLLSFFNLAKIEADDDDTAIGGPKGPRSRG